MSAIDHALIRASSPEKEQRRPVPEVTAADAPQIIATGSAVLELLQSGGSRATGASLRSSPGHPSVSAPVEAHATAARATNAPRLEPALEVDRFAWPAACQQLLARREEDFCVVAARLQSLARSGSQMVAFASTVHDEGCSTTLLCVANCLSRLDLRVIVVDAHFHHPVLASRLGVHASEGWEAVLRGRLPLAEAMVLSVHDRLALLPLNVERKAAQLLARNPRARHTLAALTQNYDLVLLDGGPVLGADATICRLLNQAEQAQALLVRNVRPGIVNHWQEAARRLEAAGIKLLGVAENFIDPHSNPADAVVAD